MTNSAAARHGSSTGAGPARAGRPGTAPPPHAGDPRIRPARRAGCARPASARSRTPGTPHGGDRTAPGSPGDTGPVGRGPGRLALRDDHRVEPAVPVILVLLAQPLGPLHTAATAEVPPEHQQRGPVGPELGEAAAPAGVVGKGDIRRMGPVGQARPVVSVGPAVQRAATRLRRPLARRCRGCSRVLADGEDLVGDETVRVAVDRVRGLGVGCLDQAEDLSGLLVHPVAQVVTPCGPGWRGPPGARRRRRPPRPRPRWCARP